MTAMHIRFHNLRIF